MVLGGGAVCWWMAFSRRMGGAPGRIVIGLRGGYAGWWGRLGSGSLGAWDGGWRACCFWLPLVVGVSSTQRQTGLGGGDGVAGWILRF